MILTDGVLVYGQNSDPEHGEMIDRDSPDFDYAPHVTYLKVAFIAAILYFSVVTSIKVSILLIVIVTGIVRVILGYAPGSQNVAFTRAELWSAVHINIAIVCACLPTLRPLLTRALAVVSSISRRLYGSGTGASGGNASAENYSGSSNSAAKNRAGVELKSVRSSNPDDPHASSRQLTRNSGELGLFQYPGPQVFRTDEPEGNAV
ncbi:hypothetical protein G7Y89_g14465 [Cudoniella acicularis]|uniref:Rhodopsin domain-containing protein n=1 Tax=Cudoniella acicularis TaxID=354080 RepID=A0A8H4VTS6_9HELO|nr:hypothetical protein G7Y89_g14465 [Cudoniella acicularis]